MKKTTLSEQDKIRVLAACIDLPPINRPQRVPNYLRAVMATVLDFYMQAKVAIGAENYFRDHVQAQYGIDSHARLLEVLSEYPDTQAGNTQAARFLWNNGHWKRVQLMRGLLRHFESIGATDMPTLQAWARQANFERDFKGKVPGLGLAVFQWLLIRCGVPTVKPDVWVFRFAQRALGRRISDKATIDLFNEISPLVGVSLSMLDATIWRFERIGLGARDVPALRIVFWQQMGKRLELRITGSSDLECGEWSIEVDDPGKLRYGEAGLHLGPISAATEGTANDLPLCVDVIQSSWQDGFTLRMSVRHDRIQCCETAMRTDEALGRAGWVSNNDGCFSATLPLDESLLMPPVTTIGGLLAQAERVADKVAHGLQSFCAAHSENLREQQGDR